jgi:hypothetical protein
MKNKNLSLLLSPLFLAGTSLLLLNDFFLKPYFHNFLTGKLSDFAGLFVFPIFFAAFFPKRIFRIFLMTFLGFIFWKSPFSEPIIQSWNSFGFFPIARVVDYSDLAALLILPASYFYLEIFGVKLSSANGVSKFATSVVVLISLFAFTATSYGDDRSFWYDKKYDLKLDIAELREKLNAIEKITVLDIHDNSSNANNPIEKSQITDFFVYFIIDEKYCDSSSLTVNMMVEPKKFIESVSVRVRCKREPTEADKTEVLKIFEREVIEKLKNQ